jgi:hypothetical protein
MKNTQAVLMLALALCATVSLVPAQDRAPNPKTLSNTARSTVHGAMTRHGHHASSLTTAVILDDDRAIVRHATDLLDEPRPAQPMESAPDALNSEFPEEWFVLDTRSRAAIEQLRSAARQHDERATLSAFGRVIETCRSCHRALRSKHVPGIPGSTKVPGLE